MITTKDRVGPEYKEIDIKPWASIINFLMWAGFVLMFLVSMVGLVVFITSQVFNVLS